MHIEPVTLEGAHVRLEPLTMDHLQPLSEVALEPEIWRWTQADVQNVDDLKCYMATAILERDQGKSLPFATVAKSAGKAIGSTRFSTIDHESRRVEIGWTWIGRPWQRTVVNTEAKLLMLTHAFETWGCIRVELKTDALNAKSRAAIARIGGREEGTLRKHSITERGRVRDTVYFGILDDEWPEVKRRLLGLL